MIRTGHGALYTGIATDVARRLAEHEQASKRAAKYLRSRGPLELAYQVRIGSRALAMKAERRIKKLSKRKKEQIVSAKPRGKELLEMLSCYYQG